MAPSAVETTTPAVTQEVANKPLPFKVHLTPYKEIDTTRVDREVEEGKTGLPAAKVCANIIHYARGRCLDLT
jgi:hypothetical protein